MGSFRGDSEDQLVSDEASDEEGSYNSEDDPNRLWCICKRPHNNRYNMWLIIVGLFPVHEPYAAFFL